MGREGRVARAIQAGEVSVKATAMAWKLLKDNEWEEVARSILQRHSATMPELARTATKDKNDRLLANVLTACKEQKSKCPRCYDPARNIAHEDSRHHARWECTSGTCVAARMAIEGRQAERITRSGPMWSTYPEHAHGASVQGTRGALAEACMARQPSSLQQRHPIADQALESLDAPTLELPSPTGAPSRKSAHIDLLGTNGNRVQATEARLRCLYTFWRGNGNKDPNSFKRDAADLIRRAHEYRYKEGTPPTAVLHPTLLTFFHNALGVKSELQANPIMTTAGIFLEEDGNDTLKSTAPTVPVGALPPDHGPKWTFTMDDPAHPTWNRTPWERGGITCIRATEIEGMSHIRRTLYKAQVTASRKGERVLVVVELPRSQEHTPHGTSSMKTNLTKVSDDHTDTVKGKQLLEIPPGYTPWKTYKDWEEDDDNTLISDPKDGTVAMTKEGRSTLTANNGTLHVILFQHVNDSLTPLNRRQLRELTRILTEVATPMPMTTNAPSPKWFGENRTLELRFSNLAPDHEGFDPRKSLQAMVPAGGWQDDRASPYHDGITPTYLVQYLQRAGATATEADAQAAYITAGHARDCHQIFATMLSTTTTNLLKTLGARPGSLSTPHSDKEPLGTCECCNKATSAMWKVPNDVSTAGPVSEAIKTIQASRARNICRREMALFPPSTPTPNTHIKANGYLLAHRTKATLCQLAADRGIHLGKAANQKMKDAVALALAAQDEEDNGTAQRGPTQVRDRIKALVESTPMKACLSCTLPLQIASVTPRAGCHSDTTTWNVVRRISQGKNKHSKIKTILPKDLLTPPQDILERGDLKRHTGRDVIWYDSAGHEHSSTVALIARDTEGGDLEAYVITHEQDRQTQEPWTRLTMKELQRAIDTKASREERHYTTLLERERIRKTATARDRRTGAATAAAAAAIVDTTTEDAVTKALTIEGYMVQKLGDDANALPCYLTQDPHALRREILRYADQHRSTYQKRLQTTTAMNQRAEQTQAEIWEQWRKDITKPGYHFGCLEIDILGAMGKLGPW